MDELMVSGVVENLVKEVKEGLQGMCKEVFVEFCWHHWKEEQKLGGDAHQGQSGWRKTTGTMDL
ncbi:hypothetical protein PPACK8108_LOCUS8279 [Phakopsora pachyrhizi]|uniref:Uncharacterized protein n=1 Tax=Phakopsora pachyrhizi TaxID=170000 RepID=A0AAV0AYW3_PHAPC|nr:hypothetical protein PPACK8108_LOCUS8279 [Phakopsora pachyrhizi]